MAKVKCSECGRLIENPHYINGKAYGYNSYKQKLAIISAFVHEPKLLILDEPFVGLDPKATVVLKNMMRELSEAGGAIFFSTHVLDVAEKFCNKVVII